MSLNEFEDAFREGTGHRQTAHNSASQLDADAGVPVEVPDAVVPGEERRRLAHVVKERRPADERISRHPVDDASGMLQDIIYMVRSSLLEALHGDEFG